MVSDYQPYPDIINDLFVNVRSDRNLLVDGGNGSLKSTAWFTSVIGAAGR
jgi:hypothetical protein